MTIFGISGDYSLVTTPDIILRNITVHRVQGQIASKEFATIRTDFKTELEQHFPEIRMRLFVDFTDENQKTWQRVIAFNETVCIVMKEEGNAFFDAEALLLYGVLLGASFLVYYFFYKPADQQTHGGRVASPSASGLLSTKSATPTESTSSLPSNNPNEWIPASHLKQQAKGKRVY